MEKHCTKYYKRKKDTIVVTFFLYLQLTIYWLMEVAQRIFLLDHLTEKGYVPVAQNTSCQAYDLVGRYQTC